MKKSTSFLKNVILLSKNVESMSSFFTQIIGLKLIHIAPDNSFAELKDSNNFTLQIKKVDINN